MAGKQNVSSIGEHQQRWKRDSQLFEVVDHCADTAGRRRLQQLAGFSIDVEQALAIRRRLERTALNHAYRSTTQRGHSPHFRGAEVALVVNLGAICRETVEGLAAFVVSKFGAVSPPEVSITNTCSNP